VTLSARILPSFAGVDAADWARLDHADNPFLSHTFLAALEASGSISAESGWTPQHLALYEDGSLCAFAPTYLKAHSHGEFVFDWAWADAYRRYGFDYYPKLLTAVPYSPVAGPRLLVRRDHPDPAALRDRLVRLALETCEQLGCSSWHCNFVAPADHGALAARGLLRRADWQFHWCNDGYGGFDDFLAALRSRKRKNILRERRQVREAGIRFQWKHGAELDDSELAFIHRCYVQTFHLYGNHPALTPDFFARLARAGDTEMRVALAGRDGAQVAMSLFLAGGGRLYGRYWGCLEETPGLHFEAAYYQGIEYCIRHGLNVFESGAQGEHKIARGFLPAATGSYHYLREEAFRAAIGQYLDRELAWMDEYHGELMQHDPYRRDSG
jgi:predicted N-acyltransferase